MKGQASASEEQGVLRGIVRECPQTARSLHEFDLESTIMMCAQDETDDQAWFRLALRKCYLEERERRRAGQEWDLRRDVTEYPYAKEMLAQVEYYTKRCVPEADRAYYSELHGLLRGELAERQRTGRGPVDPSQDPMAWVKVTKRSRSSAAKNNAPVPAEARAPAPSPAPVAAPAAAPAPKQPRAAGEVIAVFDLEDVRKSLADGDADQLTEYFAVQLSAVGYKTVPRSQLRQRLSAEKEESYKACYDESCQIDLGKAVAAQKSVATKLLKVGTTCAITATLYDLRSETTELAASVDTRCSQEELFGGLRELARKLVPGA